MARTAPDAVRGTSVVPTAPRGTASTASARGRAHRRRNPFGALSVAVAVAALGLGLLPLVGLVVWPLAIAGAVLGIVGATRALKAHVPSIVGIALSALALVVGLAVSVSGLGSVAESMAGAAGRAAPVGPVVLAHPSVSASATRVVDTVVAGMPSEAWIRTDPSGARYGGYPPLQRRVIATIASADVAYRRAASDAARSRILAERDAAVCRLLPGGVFTDWIGSVHAAGTTASGAGWISVHVATTMVFQTWDNPLSDTGLHTLVPRSSPVYRPLTQVGPGTRVAMSGRLLPSTDSCLQRQNATEDMYGLDPNFIVRLTALSAR